MRFSELPADGAATLAAAIEHLEAGGLLIHPTSGAYGIGGRTEPDLDLEVARLKGRAEGPGLIRLVSGVDGIEGEFDQARWSPVTRRLADAFWPGPLTLVLEDGSHHGLAVRAESHDFTRSLLLAWQRALGSSSLNVSGGPPASDPGAARQVLAGMPQSNRGVLFVNAGPLPGPPPSTLLRAVGVGGYEILRDGAIPVSRIAEVAEAVQTGAGGDQ